MQATRYRIMITAIVLAVIGALVPLIVMAWMSWQIAVRKELSYLSLFAQRVEFRAETTFSDAHSVLLRMQQAGLQPCTPAHIAKMRDATVNSSSVEEIGFFAEGRLRCTSWGMVESEMQQGMPDLVTNDGLNVTLNVTPYVSSGSVMTALQLGHYNVLIQPNRFVDVVLDPGMNVALLTESGRVLGARGQAIAPALLERVMSEPQGEENGRFFSTARKNGMIAIATQPSSNIAAKFVRELIVFLPIGAAIALFMVGLVIWLSRKRLSPQAELELGVRNREFIVEYQPILELKSGICVGAEALVRWRRPDGSLIRPDIFIPLAEETGLIAPITDQVIAAVVEELGGVLVSDRTLHIAINISAQDIKSGRVLAVLDQQLKKADIRPQQIWLEATERGFMEVTAARETLSAARQRGHSVAIDDFGTGYSSLSYLQQLPLDALKIDKSFVDTIGRETATSSVVLHIIDMAKDLGFFSVAEGIETQEQLDFLCAQNVDFGQGWLFSRPLPAAAFIRFQQARKSQFGAAAEVIQVTAVA